MGSSACPLQPFLCETPAFLQSPRFAVSCARHNHSSSPVNDAISGPREAHPRRVVHPRAAAPAGNFFFCLLLLAAPAGKLLLLLLLLL